LARYFGLVSPMGAYRKSIGQVSLRFTETFISIVVWNVLEIVLCFRPDLFLDVEYFPVKFLKRMFSIAFRFSMRDPSSVGIRHACVLKVG